MRKKPIKRSQLPKPKPITIKFDPRKKIQDIVMPEFKYVVMAEVEMKPQFTGEITPMPTVMLFFLSQLELKVFSIILEDYYRKGTCDMTIKQMSVKILRNFPCISRVLGSLRQRGLLLEAPCGLPGARKSRIINFKAIQHLNDLVQDEDPGVYSRIRRATRKTNILNLTKEDIRNGYDNKVLPPDHDPEEEEEYD